MIKFYDLLKILLYVIAISSLLFFVVHNQKDDSGFNSIYQYKLNLIDKTIIDSIFLDPNIDHITIAIIDGACANSAFQINNLQKTYGKRNVKKTTQLAFLIIGTPDFYIDNITSNSNYIKYPVIKGEDFKFYQRNSVINKENKLLLINRDYQILSFKNNFNNRDLFSAI